MRYANTIVSFSLFASSLSLADSRVRVLVIDTGVYKGNKALSQVFCPEKESYDATKGVYGIPEDTHGHGTHVAGIIRALAGSKGYCMAFCKYFETGESGKQSVDKTVECLKHAKSIHPLYINYSSVGAEFNEEEKNAIEALDATYVVAAGNDGKDIYDRNKTYYPAAYRLKNVVTIGSLDTGCERSSFSNYGKGVQYFFGDPAYSIVPGNKRTYMSGTSMATATATGTFLRELFGLTKIVTCSAYGQFFRDFWTSH